MKYDISSLMVTVTEEHMPFWQFLVRLCGIIGGIFSTTGSYQCFSSLIIPEFVDFFFSGMLIMLNLYYMDKLQGSL